jgi:hypothetical protein
MYININKYIFIFIYKYINININYYIKYFVFSHCALWEYIIYIYYIYCSFERIENLILGTIYLGLYI